jgi:drug/metabolite transporter (DMT)-like permease
MRSHQTSNFKQTHSTHGKPTLIPDTHPTKSPLLPYAAIIAATFLWGSSFAAMKVIIGDLGPWSVMWARMAAALLVILPFARKLWPRNYRSGDWRLLLPFVLFQPCMYFTLESNALRFTSSSQAGLISSSVPLMVAVGAYFFLHERVARQTVLGLFISIGGVVWLTLAGDATEMASNPLLGNLLEFGAMVSAAGYVLIVKRLTERYDPWTLTAMQIVTGFVYFLPGARFFLNGGLLALSPGQLLTLVYLGVFVTLGAFGFYNVGIKSIPANRASALVNLIPVIAVGFGWGLLGERLNGSQMVAAACVLGGVWVSQRKSAGRVKPEKF